MLLDYCTLVECQGIRGCSRANKRLKADIKRSVADLKQNYKNDQWPLVCPPANPTSQIDQQQLLEQNERMPVLKPDVLMCIADYLLPRELYVFVFSNKMLMSNLSVEVVINSAMMAGGNAKETVDEIQRLMCTGAIYPPSALRLLCLINGRLCEICGINRVKHVRRGYGINVCWKCVTSGDTTEIIKPENYNNQNQRNVVHALLSNCRLATSPSGWYESDFRETRALYEAKQRGTPVRWVTRVSSNGTPEEFPFVLVGNTWIWKRTLKDSRGDLIGPVITLEHVQELSIESIDRALGFKPNHQAIIDRMTINSLRNRGVQSLSSEKYLTFVNTYFSLFHKAINRAEFRRLQAKTRSEKVKAERLANSVAAIKRLGEMIENPLVREKLFYKIEPLFYSRHIMKRDVPCLFMYNRQARKILREHLCNPVKMTKNATLKALAEELSQEV